MNNPTGVAVDAAGDLYIADSDNDRVREVSNGVTHDGGGQWSIGAEQWHPGRTGLRRVQRRWRPGHQRSVEYPDQRLGGIPVQATFTFPITITIGSARFRCGIINTVAGRGPNGGFAGFSGDGGPATSAQLSEPWGTAVDSA